LLLHGKYMCCIHAISCGLELSHAQATLHINRCFLLMLRAFQSLVGMLCNNMHADMQVHKSWTFQYQRCIDLVSDGFLPLVCVFLNIC